MYIDITEKELSMLLGQDKPATEEKSQLTQRLEKEHEQTIKRVAVKELLSALAEGKVFREVNNEDDYGDIGAWYHPYPKIAIIKAVRQVFEIDLQSAKDLVEGTLAPVLGECPRRR